MGLSTLLPLLKTNQTFGGATKKEVITKF